jgi:hypothetical protein
VAAATEGFLLGIPSIAVSLASKAGGNYPTAARVIADLIGRYRERPPLQPMLLNRQRAGYAVVTDSRHPGDAPGPTAQGLSR